MMDPTLAIRGGLVFDGLSSPPRRADVGVSGRSRGSGRARVASWAGALVDTNASMAIGNVTVVVSARHEVGLSVTPRGSLGGSLQGDLGPISRCASYTAAEDERDAQLARAREVNDGTSTLLGFHHHPTIRREAASAYERRVRAARQRAAANASAPSPTPEPNAEGARRPVAGDTFVAIVELCPEGPRAEGLLSYGNASPTGPHASDDLELMATGRMRRPLLEREEIEAEAIETVRLEPCLACGAGR